MGKQKFQVQFRLQYQKRKKARAATNRASKAGEVTPTGAGIEAIAPVAVSQTAPATQATTPREQVSKMLRRQIVFPIFAREAKGLLSPKTTRLQSETPSSR